MPSEVASRDGGAGVSMTAQPKSRAASSKAPRVTPGKAPVVSGGVWRELGSHQKTFPLELSVTMPSVFTSKASSNPSASASARAKTFRSLLADLWADNGSPAATLNDEHVLRVSAGQPARGIGGDGWAVMMNLGTSAPRGEYPRGPTPRLEVHSNRGLRCGQRGGDGPDAGPYLGFIPVDSDTEELRAQGQSIPVLLPSKKSARIPRQAFEESVAVKERTVEHRNQGLRHRQDLAIHPNGFTHEGRLPVVTSETVAGDACSARKSPLALARVSSYSASGTESATMPAPTWNQARSLRVTAERMVMLSWLSRLKPR